MITKCPIRPAEEYVKPCRVRAARNCSRLRRQVRVGRSRRLSLVRARRLHFNGGSEMWRHSSGDAVVASHSGLLEPKTVLIVVPKWMFLRSAVTLAVIFTALLGVRVRSTTVSHDFPGK